MSTILVNDLVKLYYDLFVNGFSQFHDYSTDITFYLTRGSTVDLKTFEIGTIS